jgi:type III secretion system FlhB-like substrate exporter
MKRERKKNLGLAIKPESRLPYVVFKGYGVYADYYEKEFKKKKAASRVVRDRELLEKLAKLPVKSEISPDLYEVVAILLIYVYSCMKRDNNKKKEKNVD